MELTPKDVCMVLKGKRTFSSKNRVTFFCEQIPVFIAIDGKIKFISCASGLHEPHSRLKDAYDKLKLLTGEKNLPNCAACKDGWIDIDSDDAIATISRALEVKMFKGITIKEDENENKQNVSI